MTIRTPPNAEHDLVGGIDNNGSIGTGLDSGKLTVPFVIHLLLDQFRGEGLGDQAVGIGLSLGFNQFGFGVDLSGFFFLVGFRDSNFFFFFGIDVGGLLLDLCQLQILLSVDLFLDSCTGFVIGVDSGNFNFVVVGGKSFGIGNQNFMLVICRIIGFEPGTFFFDL